MEVVLSSEAPVAFWEWAVGACSGLGFRAANERFCLVSF